MLLVVMTAIETQSFSIRYKSVYEWLKFYFMEDNHMWVKYNVTHWTLSMSKNSMSQQDFSWCIAKDS